MKTMRGQWLALLVWAVFAAGGVAGEAVVGQKTVTKSPKHGQEFAYYVPKNYDPEKKWPLVLSYHGAMGKGPAEIGQWIGLAEKHGFLVACPTCIIAGCNTKPAQPVRYSPEQYQRDLEDALAIVAWMGERYNVDPLAVMVTGFSGGGNPSFLLAFSYPEVFRFFCGRCPNFPRQLMFHHQQKTPAFMEKLEKIAAGGYLYYYYGERDHPIILKDVQTVIPWLESLQLKNLKVEKIPGMGHNSKAPLAAEWFVEKLAVARATPQVPEKELTPEERYAQAVETGKNLLEEDHYAQALPFFRKAEAMEKENRDLGRDGARGVRKVERYAEKLYDKARKLERKKDLRGAVPLYNEVIKDFAETRAAEKAEKRLKRLMESSGK